MLYSKPELVLLAVRISQEFKLDPALICAHIDVRSHWDSGLTLPTATYYAAPNRSALESEHRATIWGLMAISGEFALSQGFANDLTTLLMPVDNLREGCRLVLRLSEKFGSPVDALLRWNNFPDREMVEKILTNLEPYRALLSRTPSELCTFFDACKTLL